MKKQNLKDIKQTNNQTTLICRRQDIRDPQTSTENFLEIINSVMGQNTESTHTNQELLYIQPQTCNKRDQKHTPNHNSFKENKIRRNKPK